MTLRLYQMIRSVALSSLALFSIGAGIWFFMRDTQTSFQDILFYVGAAPIAFFSLGTLGHYAGRGHAAFQLSRTAGKASSNERSLQDEQDQIAKARFSRSWVLAGGLVWLISYFL